MVDDDAGGTNAPAVPDVEAVRRLARAFFQRELSSDELADQIGSGRSCADLWRSNVTSFELQHKLNRLGEVPGRYGPVRGPAVLALVGGRAALEVARQFALTSGIAVVGLSHLDALVPERLGPLALADAHVVVLDDESGEAAVAADKCRAAGFRVRTMRAPCFAGLHPDAVYLPPREPTIAGLSGWHSALVAHAYVAGLSRVECRARFAIDVYRRHGYLDAFEREASRLDEADRGMDMPIAAGVVALARETPCMSTPLDGNQPLHRLMARTIATYLAIPIDGRAAPSTAMSRVAVWPVYPGLTRHLGFDHGGRMQFTLEAEGFGLDHMINRSYRSYAFWGRDPIRQAFARSFAERSLTEDGRRD